MKKVIIVVAILGAIAAAAWFIVKNMGSSASLERYVPEQSAIVMTIDLPSMFKKMEPAKLKERELWKKLKRESDDSASILLVEQAMNSPEMTGIGFSTNPVVFIEPSSKKRANARTGFVFSLQDPVKFRDFVSGLMPDQVIREEGDHFVISTPNTKHVWIWNDKVALLYNHDTKAGALPRADSIISKQVEPISNSKLYKKYSAQGHDISVYMHAGVLQEMAGSEVSILKNMLGLPENYAVCAGITFNAGKVDLSVSTLFENKEDAKKAQLMKSEAGVNYLGQVAEKDPVVAFQARIDYEKLFDRLLDDPEAADGLKEIAESAKIQRKELRDLFTGDLCFSFNGFEEQITAGFMPGMESDTTMVPQFAFFVGVKDQKILRKIFTAQNMTAEEGKYIISLPFFADIFLVETKEGIVVTMSDELAGKLAASGKLSDGEFGAISDFSKKHSSTFYANLDLGKMPPSVTKSIEDFDAAAVLLKPMSTLKYWTETTEEARGELAFRDEKTNSLQLILDLFDGVIRKQEQDRLRREEEQMRRDEELIEEMIESGEYE